MITFLIAPCLLQYAKIKWANQFEECVSTLRYVTLQPVHSYYNRACGILLNLHKYIYVVVNVVTVQDLCKIHPLFSEASLSLRQCNVHIVNILSSCCMLAFT